MTRLSHVIISYKNCRNDCTSVFACTGSALCHIQSEQQKSSGEHGRPADFLFEKLLAAITWCPGENESVLNGENENQQDS